MSLLPACLPPPSSSPSWRLSRFGRCRAWCSSIALSTLIYLTFAIGWTAHWLYAKYVWSRDGESIERELEKRVYEAETEKDAAVHKLHEVEDAFESYARQAEADHAATLDELGRARREAEYYRQQQLGHPGS